MKILTNTKDMPRDEWLKYRRLGIGGSDAGAICGLNPYRSAIDVWVDKTSDRPDEEKPDSEAMRVGRDLEDYVARRFTEMTGKKVHRRNAMMQDEEYPFMIANIDRMVTGEKALLECKTANAYNADKWSDGKIPESYEIQCHHYMAVTGSDRVYIACLIMGIDFVVRIIERDEEVISNLRSIESDFWNRYVLGGEMPPPDGSDSYTEALRSRYPESDPGGVVNLPESEYSEKAARIDEIEGRRKDLDAEEKRLKQEIQAAMGDAETAWIGDRKVTWKSTKPRETLDSRKIRADLPDVYAKYVKTGKASRRFTISKRKAAEE